VPKSTNELRAHYSLEPAWGAQARMWLTAS